MRPFVLLPFAVLLGCASASTPAANSAPRAVVVQHADGSSETFNNTPDLASATRVAATPEEVWQALPAVYASLSIPVTRSEPAARVFGGERAQVKRALGKTSLSRYLSCGDLPQGKIADLYDVRLTVLTQLGGADAHSTAITTIVQAQARAATVNSGETTCTSTGVLEERIITAVRERLKA